MANFYSTLASRVEAALATALAASYSGLVVDARFFDPGKLPTFTRYCIIVSPPQNDAWQERVIAVRKIQDILLLDLYLLVKNFDDVNSVFGDTSPNSGIFQLVSDVKGTLRGNSLSGLVDRDFSEPAGPLAIEYAASAGLDSGEQAFVRRARLRYTAKMIPVCYPLT